MTQTAEPIANTESTGRAGIAVDGSPLTPQARKRVLRVLVDNDIRLPGMFELTLLDLDGKALSDTKISIGATVTVSGAGSAGTTRQLIFGEVTAIEGLLDGITMKTVVRGYTAAHRLQRARRTRSFLNSPDSEIARTVAQGAGLEVGTIEPTSTVHAYAAQVNQTDWEFLSARAHEIGYEMGVADGSFFFRSAASDAASGAAPTVEFRENLLSFRPRVTAGNLTPDVEARAWDPMARKAVAENATTPSGSGTAPSTLGGQYTSGGTTSIAGEAAATSAATAAVANTVSGLTCGLVGSPIGDLGPPPSPTANVMANKPFADETTLPTAGPPVASALGSDHGSTYAEAEGEAIGDADIQPGNSVTVQGVQSMFAGSWRVSRARHIFDDSEHGYRVIFSAHGHQDRTMLGLTAKSRRSSPTGGVLDGVVCGVVTNCLDPLGKGRVKISLPWLSPDFETDWASLAQNYSAQKGGSIYMPEIGDEVLVAFEFGDVRRPYVLGAFMNNLTEWSIAKSGPLGAFGLESITEVLAGEVISMAGAAAGALIAGPALAPLGAAIGSAVADAAYSEANAAVESEISGASSAPGMVSEVHHRGVVSNTGNALLFYDEPPPLPAPSQADATGAMGMSSSGSGGGTGSTDGSLAHPGMGALGSAVRLGSQGGEFGLTVDQVNGGVTLNAKTIPGVTLNPVPAMNLSTENGFINVSAGESGCVMIDGGVAIVIKASVAVTIDAPAIKLIGFTTVDGVPVV